MEVTRSLITSVGIDNTTINFYHTGNETEKTASAIPHLALSFYIFPCTDRYRCQSKDRLEPGWYTRRHSESSQWNLRHPQSGCNGYSNQQGDLGL